MCLLLKVGPGFCRRRDCRLFKECRYSYQKSPLPVLVRHTISKEI